MAQVRVIQPREDGHLNVILPSGKLLKFERNADGKLEGLVDEGPDLEHIAQIDGFEIATAPAVSDSKGVK